MTFAFIQGIGPLELTIVLVILLLVLGPKRLPAMGRQLGAGMREFKDSVTSRHDREDPPGAAPGLDRPSGAPATGARVAADERPPEGEVVSERR